MTFAKTSLAKKIAESEVIDEVACVARTLLGHRTDGTDAFDTLYIGCEKFPYRDTFSLSMSGVLKFSKPLILKDLYNLL